MTHEQAVWNSAIAAWRGDMNAKIAQLSAAVAQIGGEPVRIVKEEKMLNVEKYLTTIKEETAKDACASKLCLIAKVRGDESPDCNDRTCRDCSDEPLDWLFSEHEPPRLKNGDGLKPGGEILVKNSNYANWEREKFLCYLDGLFFTTYNLDLPYSPEEFRAACWRYARLPEDGE